MKGLLTCLLLSISLVAYSQVEAGDSSNYSIPWHPEYKLKWSDFQGKRPLDSTYAGKNAGCASVIKIESYYDMKVKFKVTNHFHKLRSWTTDTTSITLLEHEQIHFDISEVYCRKIRRGISDLDRNGNASEEDYRNLIQLLDIERGKYGNRYDIETKNGVNGTKQLEWREKIDKELASLNAYYESNVIEVEDE